MKIYQVYRCITYNNMRENELLGSFFIEQKALDFTRSIPDIPESILRITGILIYVSIQTVDVVE